MGSRIDGDLYINGYLSSRTMGIPNGSIINDDVSGSAAIAATKLVQQHMLTYAQESATAAADEARVMHGVYGATGTIIAFEIGSVVANIGNSVVDVDLLLNGTTVFTTVPQLSSSETAYGMVAGTLVTTGIVDGDILEVSINGTIGSGTLAKGVFVNLTLREDPQ